MWRAFLSTSLLPDGRVSSHAVPWPDDTAIEASLSWRPPFLLPPALRTLIRSASHTPLIPTGEKKRPTSAESSALTLTLHAV